MTGNPLPSLRSRDQLAMGLGLHRAVDRPPVTWPQQYPQFGPHTAGCGNADHGRLTSAQIGICVAKNLDGGRGAQGAGRD